MWIDLIDKFLILRLLYTLFLFYHIADEILDLTLHLFYFPHQAVKLRDIRLFMHRLKSAVSNLYHLPSKLIQRPADYPIKIKNRQGEDQKRCNYDERHPHSPMVDLILIHVVRQRHCINVSHLAPVCHDLISLSCLNLVISL